MNLEQYEDKLKELESKLLSNKYSLCFVMGFTNSIYLRMDKETGIVEYTNEFDLIKMDFGIWAEVLFHEIHIKRKAELNPFEQFIFDETFNGSMKKLSAYYAEQEAIDVERRKKLDESALRASEEINKAMVNQPIPSFKPKPIVKEESPHEDEVRLVRQRADYEFSDYYKENW